MQLGVINKLQVIKKTENGYLLTDKDGKSAILSDTELNAPLKINDTVDAFIYNGNKNIISATLKTPTITFEQFAYLQVKDINKIGAFMNWGIPKDLLIPYPEQTAKMVVGEWHLVFLFLDEESNRLAGSCIEDDFLLFDTDRITLEIGDKVDLLLFNESELGMNAIVNNMHKGLIFSSDVHKNIKQGDSVKGYVKNIREDGHIDLLLEPLGYRKSIDPATRTILIKLEENYGILNLTDKSKPEIIKQQLGLSKKSFKRAIGNLYRQKKILIFSDCIKLI